MVIVCGVLGTTGEYSKTGFAEKDLYGVKISYLCAKKARYHWVFSGIPLFRMYA